MILVSSAVAGLWVLTMALAGWCRAALLTVAVLAIVLKTSPEGKQVTREPLEDTE